MNRRQSLVLSVAVALSPRDQREGRNEQWLADLRDAEELGVPRRNITTGALLTAVTSTRKQAALVRNNIIETRTMMEVSNVRARPPATTQLGCAAEAQALIGIIGQAVPLVESAEALISKFSEEDRPTSDDAREGLRIRLRFVNLLGPLNELRCCPEHALVQSEMARLFTFYLHMITRSFEIRFSTLGRIEYEISTAHSTTTTRYARLLGLRASLVESLDSFPALRAEDSPMQTKQLAPQEADRRVLLGLIVAGLIVVMLSIVTVIWQSSAAQNISFTCGDLGCQASDPGLYFLTTAALLFAPALLAAGALAAVIAFGMTRLLVSARLYRKTANTTGFRMAVIWAPGIVLTAVSTLALLYISQASKSPGALCMAGKCTDEYAFTVLLHTLAPASLLTGIVCLLIAALSRTLPHADLRLPTSNDEPTLLHSGTEAGGDVTELTSRPPLLQANPKLFMRPTEGSRSDES